MCGGPHVIVKGSQCLSGSILRCELANGKSHIAPSLLVQQFVFSNSQLVMEVVARYGQCTDDQEL